MSTVETEHSMTEWRPSASLAALRLRARLLADIRAFFAAREVLEVETPVLATTGSTDPQLHSLITRYTGPPFADEQRLYLHTSPEFPMKRLLAAGSGCIYQITRVFRDGEAGRHHNPEFTLLEWYRVGFDHHRLMDEVTELITALLAATVTLLPSERLSYGEAFRRHLELDPYRTSVHELADCAARHGLTVTSELPRDDPNPWLDLLLSHCIQPHLGQNRLTFLYDYPASQAALARIRKTNPPVGERFELYLYGIELANGFHELDNADEQRHRFQQDNGIRRNQGLPTVPPDNRLLNALTAGLPPCAGVALGFDRLVMLAAGHSSLADVVAFPIDLC